MESERKRNESKIDLLRTRGWKGAKGWFIKNIWPWDPSYVPGFRDSNFPRMLPRHQLHDLPFTVIRMEVHSVRFGSARFGSFGREMNVLLMLCHLLRQRFLHRLPSSVCHPHTQTHTHTHTHTPITLKDSSQIIARIIFHLRKWVYFLKLDRIILRFCSSFMPFVISFFWRSLSALLCRMSNEKRWMSTHKKKR